MYIWWWNPYTKRLYVLEAKTTIHGVASLDEAHKLMDNNFDPSKYQFICQTKTGKPYNFSSIEDAEKFAIEKSNKRVSCTVYSNGVAIMTFLNKERLPQWETIFCEKHRVQSRSEFCENAQYHKACRGYWQLANTKVERLGNKVRVVDTHMRYVKCRTGYIATQWDKSSVTFHENGNVIDYRGGHIDHRNVSNIYISGDVEEPLRKELIRLRPELKEVLSTCSFLRIAEVFSRPTYHIAFDTYQNKTWNRPSILYSGYFPREVVDESQIINVLAKRMKIPCTKALKKVYAERLDNMVVVKFLKDIGFKDTNSYQKLVGFGIHFCLNNPKRFADFIKTIIELRSENHVVKMISDTSYDLIFDVIRLYDIMDKDLANVIIKDARNFEEIHETFNRTRSNIRLNERKIKYSEKEEKKFNYVCKSGAKFELASSNKDLAIIGQAMGICVGGYGHEAVAKKTTIIKMTKNGKYIACIEFKDGYVVQIKSSFNNAVPLEFKNDIDEWAANGKINHHCRDYDRIGEPWGKSYNYAHVNPDNFIPEGHEPVFQIIKREHERYTHNNSWFSKTDYIPMRIEERAKLVDVPWTNIVERQTVENEWRRARLEMPMRDHIAQEPIGATFTQLEEDELPF